MAARPRPGAPSRQTPGAHEHRRDPSRNIPSAAAPQSRHCSTCVPEFGASRGKLSSFNSRLDHPVRRAFEPIYTSAPQRGPGALGAQNQLRCAALCKFRRFSSDSELRMAVVATNRKMPGSDSDENRCNLQSAARRPPSPPELARKSAQMTPTTGPVPAVRGDVPQSAQVQPSPPKLARILATCWPMS